MDEFTINENDLDWIPANERFRVNKGKPEPRYDEEVSKVVGFPVPVNDPRLIRLVVKYKRKNAIPEDSASRDDHLHNPQFLKELKEAFIKK